MSFVFQTVRHGFPYQPTAMAYDPVQNLLAIGTKSGSLRMYPFDHTAVMPFPSLSCQIVFAWLYPVFPFSLQYWVNTPHLVQQDWQIVYDILYLTPFLACHYHLVILTCLSNGWTDLGCWLCFRFGQILFSLEMLFSFGK